MALEIFQTRTIAQANASLRAGRNVIIQAPTGAGKTAVISGIADDFCRQNRDSKALILENSRTLVEQLAGPAHHPGSGEVNKWSNLKVGRVVSDLDGADDVAAPVIVGITDSVQNRIEEFELGGQGEDWFADVRLVLIDEAHHAVEAAEGEPQKEYAAILDYLERRSGGKLQVVALSATPFRSADDEKLDRRIREPMADRIVVSYAEVIASGRILRPITEVPEIRNAKGETFQELLLAAIRRDGLDDAFAAGARINSDYRDEIWLANAVDYWAKGSAGRRAIWYANTTQEVEEIAAAMAARGLHAGDDFVTVYESRAASATPEEVRKRFADSKDPLRAAISCQMLVEGFDAPETDTVVYAQPGTVLPRQIQIAGRAMRATLNSGKATRLIDFGFTSFEHGAIEERIDRQAALMDPKGAGLLLKRDWVKLDANWRGTSDSRNDYYLRKGDGKLWESMAREPNGDLKGGTRAKRAHCGAFEEGVIAKRIKQVAEASDKILGLKLLPPTADGLQQGRRNFAEEFMRARLYRNPSALVEEKRTDAGGTVKSLASTARRDLGEKALKRLKGLKVDIADPAFLVDAAEAMGAAVAFVKALPLKASDYSRATRDQIVEVTKGLPKDGFASLEDAKRVLAVGADLVAKKNVVKATPEELTIMRSGIERALKARLCEIRDGEDAQRAKRLREAASGKAGAEMPF